MKTHIHPIPRSGCRFPSATHVMAPLPKRKQSSRVLIGLVFALGLLIGVLGSAIFLAVGVGNVAQ